MKKNAGFTLIEITVVMAIIGILAVISIGSYRTTQIKTRDSQRKNDMEQISNTVEVYYNDKGQYPLNSADNKINGCVSEATCEWGEDWSDENNTTYMVEMPADPRDYLNYYYESDGTYFQVYARLENDLDYEVPTSGDDPANYNISCGDYNCNYGVSSTNITISDGRSIVAD
jgi:prepilin-type N-terminal cleavage/methylation domain-containing protein